MLINTQNIAYISCRSLKQWSGVELLYTYGITQCYLPPNTSEHTPP